MAPKVMGEVSRSIKFQHQRPGLLKNLMQILDSSICAPKSLMMSFPLTFVLSADTETDVRLIHHSPLGNLDCQWHWQTSGEIAPCGPCRSSGSSVMDRKSNSIPSRMLSWLTGSITAHVYSPGHLIQSLSDAAGWFPLLPKGGPRLDANHIPKVGEDWPGVSRFFFWCLPKSIIVEFTLSEIEIVLGTKRYLVCPMSKVYTKYKLCMPRWCSQLPPKCQAAWRPWYNWLWTTQEYWGHPWGGKMRLHMCLLWQVK